MNSDSNIADLLRALRDETTTLVREEIALARTELSENLSKFGRTLTSLAIGAMVSFSALLLMLVALSVLAANWFADRGSNPGTATFLGFMCVSIIVGIASVALVSKAYKSLANTSLRPDRTVRSLREDKQWAQEKLS